MISEEVHRKNIEDESNKYNRETEMAQTDIRTVDKATLVDIKDVKIKPELPEHLRVLDYIEQIKNPYCYLDHGIIVKISLKKSQSIEDALIHYVKSIER